MEQWLSCRAAVSIVQQWFTVSDDLVRVQSETAKHLIHLLSVPAENQHRSCRNQNLTESVAAVFGQNRKYADTVTINTETETELGQSLLSNTMILGSRWVSTLNSTLIHSVTFTQWNHQKLSDRWTDVRIIDCYICNLTITTVIDYSYRQTSLCNSCHSVSLTRRLPSTVTVDTGGVLSLDDVSVTSVNVHHTHASITASKSDRTTRCIREAGEPRCHEQRRGYSLPVESHLWQLTALCGDREAEVSWTETRVQPTSWVTSMTAYCSQWWGHVESRSQFNKERIC